jgi:hypothetical protein
LFGFPVQVTFKAVEDDCSFMSHLFRRATKVGAAVCGSSLLIVGGRAREPAWSM